MSDLHRTYLLEVARGTNSTHPTHAPATPLEPTEPVSWFHVLLLELAASVQSHPVSRQHLEEMLETLFNYPAMAAALLGDESDNIISDFGQQGMDNPDFANHWQNVVIPAWREARQLFLSASGPGSA